MNAKPKDVECPYCGEWQDICHDDGSYGYGEDTNYEQYCLDCKRAFTYTTSVSFNYHVSRPKGTP